MEMSSNSVSEFVRAKYQYDAIKKHCEDQLHELVLKLTQTLRHDAPDVSVFEVIELLEQWKQPT